jgi:hypothetical protein
MQRGSQSTFRCVFAAHQAWTLSVAAKAHLKRGSQSSPELVTDVGCFNILVIFVGAAHLIPSHSHVTYKHTHNAWQLSSKEGISHTTCTHARVSARARTNTHLKDEILLFWCNIDLGDRGDEFAHFHW